MSSRHWQERLQKYLRCPIQGPKRGRGGALVCPQPVSQDWITREFLPRFHKAWNAFEAHLAERPDPEPLDEYMTVDLPCGHRTPASLRSVAAILWKDCPEPPDPNPIHGKSYE